MTTKPYGLAKGERLRSLTAVRRLFQDGASGFVYPIRYTIYIEKSTSPSVEVLFSVPKRNHKRANRRNLLRRRMKEAYRLAKGDLQSLAMLRGVGIDVALIYSSKDVLSYNSIDNAVRRILQEIVERC